MKRLIAGIGLLLIVVLLLAMPVQAGNREIRLVCKDRPAIEMHQNGAQRWIVTIFGDCAKPDSKQSQSGATPDLYSTLGSIYATIEAGYQATVPAPAYPGP